MTKFSKIKNNLGFGCMRLPMKNGEVDYTEFTKMIDRFMEGFNYFDTAHGYVGGRSETVLRDCLTSRYPRESYVLTDKLTDSFFKKEEDIIPLFNTQLERCGVDYFDFYLMHALTARYYKKFEAANAFEIAKQFKAQGKIKHIGISFHDKEDVLEKILNEHPEIEVVQIQFNYADYDDPRIRSGAVYEMCRRFDKPVIVMEPVKGGGLVNLPDDAKVILDSLGGGSYASYAIRYAASFEGVMTVLSGMSNMEQVEDNIGYMKNFVQLSKKEFAAIEKVKEIFKNQDLIPCTACEYCVDGCPMNISIPDLFASMNDKNQYKDWNSEFYYEVNTHNRGKAKDCVQCGKCEIACPQHLEIRKLLKDVSKVFD